MWIWMRDLCREQYGPSDEITAETLAIRFQFYPHPGLVEMHKQSLFNGSVKLGSALCECLCSSVSADFECNYCFLVS